MAPRAAARAPKHVASLLAPPAQASGGARRHHRLLLLPLPRRLRAVGRALRLPGAETRSCAWRRPSLSHPFGTDQFGRDIFSRVIVGTRNIFLIGGLGTLIAVVIGTAIGLVAGYMGGTGDEVIMRLLDVLLSFPSLLLAMVLLARGGAVQPQRRAGGRDPLHPDGRARRAQHGARPQEQGVRRGGARARREAQLHPLPRDPAQLPAAAAGRGDHALLVLDLPGRLARVPRPRRPAAVAGLGAADQRGAQLLPDRAVGAALPGLHHRGARDLHEPHVATGCARSCCPAAGGTEVARRADAPSSRSRACTSTTRPSSACCTPCATSRSRCTSTRASASSASPARASRRWPWAPSATWPPTARSPTAACA